MSALPLLFSLLWPMPRQAAVAPDLQMALPVRVEATAGLAGPAALLERELKRIFGPRAVGASGKTRIRLALAPGELKRPEEYTLETAPTVASLRGHDVQGVFWAAHSFIQLLGGVRRGAGGYLLPGAKVRDWPETPFRAFMTQAAWAGTPEVCRRNLDLMARMKITYFAWEFGPQVTLDFDPTIAQGQKLSKAQAKEMIDYGRSLGLKPIAYLNLLGHLDRAYRKAGYTDHDGILVASDETYEKFVYPILEEMLQVYGPVEYFHCGMDEAWDLFTWYSQQGMDSADLVARHITKVNAFLKARGVKLVIWHDMLIAPELKEKLGAPVGPANGGPPRNTARALAAIPKDVILDYWFYDPLEAYPALDYLREQGFSVWASPWQTPFSLVRYAQARGVPTMGTLWSGPPGCFYSPTFSPVTALYAQAAWNPAAAPAGVNPEPQIAARAQQATNAELWCRRSLEYPGKGALLLSPGNPVKRARLSWPADIAKAPEVLSGVPFDFGEPAAFSAMPSANKPVAEGAAPAYVLLPGNEKLVLDGFNTGRGENQLVLYAAPKTSTGTNIYGAEVTVSATGEVTAIADYGAGDHPIPPGGFVLSAHHGNNAARARRILSLRLGQRITVCDAAGNWIGGHEPLSFALALPDGGTVPFSAVDRPREADSLMLYQPGYNGGRTGANEFGIEVIVRQGKVVEARKGVGNAAIPEDGWVLSAHRGATGAGADALERLKVGDAVRVLLNKGGQSHDLTETLAGRSCKLAVGAACPTLFLALASEASTAPGALMATCIVRYADGQTERLPIRYAAQALPVSGRELPHTFDGSAWLATRKGEPAGCLVTEWTNPRPEVVIESVSFEPAPQALETGYRVLAVTASTGR